MVVELKDKLEAVTIAEEKIPASKAGVEADVVSVLTNLGYDGRAAESAVAEGKRSVGVSSFEKLLKAALQELSGRQPFIWTAKANDILEKVKRAKANLDNSLSV